ncbi:hypothetical protein RIF29_20228 [Crotalaria pallida]|uniref:HMA domain-containing protein n=1 Tax=Crotalaria pallida TaxID=3830 RepID=A0AAN9IC62_CROPI
MKRMDIFCASQASTAICLSMDPAASCSSSNTIQLGGKAIDRHNPIISDSRRITPKTLTGITPCSSSQLPVDPKLYHEKQHQKAKKNSSSKPIGQNKKKAIKGHDDQKKKSTAENFTEHVTNSYSSKPIGSVLRRSWLKPHGELFTPPGSTRCLLSDMALMDGLSDKEPVSALAMVDNKKPQVVHQSETNLASKPSSSSLKNPGSSDQVVELRVSLHCKGCEGKVRKHLSRMKGVTSFNIDFKAKKVTVVGDVTPLSVLASISKVKNAQFWPASASQAGTGFVESKGSFYI